ncbi:hypothetical protein SprV_0100145800 [Sparganum proliferum]
METPAFESRILGFTGKKLLTTALTGIVLISLNMRSDAVYLSPTCGTYGFQSWTFHSRLGSRIRALVRLD